jgi:hypothetical protein
LKLRPRNWKEFQHYKDRRPPWIRLYHRLLDDPDLWEMPADDYRHLTMIWLIASEHQDGDLPETKKLAFRLRMTEQQATSLLARLNQWLSCDASKPLAEPEQVATPEAEAEAETEGETEAEESAPLKAPLFVLPDWIPRGTWHEFELMRRKIRKPMTDRARENIIAKLDRFRGRGQDVDEVLNRSITNGWQDVWEIEGRANGKQNGKGHGIIAAAQQAIQNLADREARRGGDGSAGERGFGDPGILFGNVVGLRAERPATSPEILLPSKTGTRGNSVS